MPNPTYPTMESISLPQFSSMIQDVVTGVIPALALMQSKGMVEEKAGGLQILEQMDLVASPNFGAINAADPVTTSEFKSVTSAQYAWKIYAGSLQANIFEMFQNSGKAKVHDLMDSKVDNLIRSAKNILDRDLLGDGSAFGGLAIQGMRLMIENGAAWATYAGIDSNADSQWRNQFIGTSGSAAATLLRNLTAANISAKRRGHKIGLHLTSANGLAAYIAYCQQVMRINVIRNQAAADLGIDAVDFDGAPIVNDENVESTSWYGICLDTTKFYVGKGFNLTLTPLMQAMDQLIKMRMLVWFGNLGTNDRATNFLIDGITYP